jgi:membrane-bound lytic murein transglycosylase B
MQFPPSTWRAYGKGDIDDPRDAILAAARYLKANGAPRNLRNAVYAYNHSSDYVEAVRRLAARMRTDERSYLAYYAWQVYYDGRRLTGP